MEVPRLQDLSSDELDGHRVLVRVDFNVPLEGGAIADDTRIRAALPTLGHVLDRGGALVVASHLGRPKGKVVEELRMRPVAERLGELLPRHEVRFVPDVAGDEARAAAWALEPGQVLVLDNLRFEPGETANDPEFAAALAKLGQVFVQDAFGVCHRAHASTVGVPRLLKPAVAGHLLAREVDAFHHALDEPVRPLVAIVGGAKVSDKILVLERLLEKVDVVLVGGGMAYTFLKAMGRGIGDSLCEEDRLEVAREVLEKAARNGIRFLLPEDHVCAREFSAEAEAEVFAGDVPDGWMGLDIGPTTRERFAEAVRGAGTVVWNGPMGVFEFPKFAAGTLEVARAVAACPGHTVVGGGDSVAALHRTGLTDRIRHVSTGGGAFLALLEGKELPGLAALRP